MRRAQGPAGVSRHDSNRDHLLRRPTMVQRLGSLLLEGAPLRLDDFRGRPAALNTPSASAERRLVDAVLLVHLAAHHLDPRVDGAIVLGSPTELSPVVAVAPPGGV